MSRWSAEEKDAVARTAFELTTRYVVPPHVPPFRACLWYAVAGAEFFSRVLGVRTVIQAGSASWPRIDMKDDDGRVMTHFSYLFNPIDIPVALATGTLPEMHCWFGIVDTQEIVDLSVVHQPKMSEFARYPWRGPRPADYLWFSADTYPENVRYEPDRFATEFLHFALKSLKVTVPWSKNPMFRYPTSRKAKHNPIEARPGDKAPKPGKAPAYKGKLKHPLFPTKKKEGPK